MGADSSSSSEENATPSSATAAVSYDAPSWFLQHNVKTVAQLQCFQPKIRFVETEHKVDDNENSIEEDGTDDEDVNENSQAIEEDDEMREPSSHDHPQDAAFCVNKDTFTSVRDTLASVLVRDRHNRLPKDKSRCHSSLQQGRELRNP